MSGDLEVPSCKKLLVDGLEASFIRARSNKSKMENQASHEYDDTKKLAYKLAAKHFADTQDKIVQLKALISGIEVELETPEQAVKALKAIEQELET